MMPDVDIIIPTYNSESTIERCLKSIRNQDYTGKMIITIIDGGSSDKTIDIANKYEANIIIKEGMYATGKNGARHYGESITNSDLIWNIDSDNIIVEATVLSRLVEPLLVDKTINISIPLTAIDKTASTFNRWTSLVEIKNVEDMILNGIKTKDGYVLITRMSYGLTNCSLLRRKVVNCCGGYDSDVRLLRRIERLELSRAVVDLKSHFYHNQTLSILHYLRKFDRRLKRFGNMSRKDLSQYFVEYPPIVEDDFKLKTDSIKTMVYNPLLQLSYFLRDHNVAWLWGLPYSFLFSVYVSMHPLLAYKAFRHFL